MIRKEIANKGCFFEIPDKSDIFSLYCPSFFNKYKQERALYRKVEQLVRDCDEVKQRLEDVTMRLDKIEKKINVET